MAIRRMVDPKVVKKKKGGYAQGSAELDDLLKDQQSKMKESADDDSDSYESFGGKVKKRVTSQYGGSNLGDKTTSVKSEGPLSGGSKKAIKNSMKNVRSNSASKQAKRSAIKLYR